MENRKQNIYFEKIGDDLIESQPELQFISLYNLKICYLESDYEKISNGKVIFGECEKVPDKHKWSIDYDFTITLYLPNIAGLTDEQIKMLIHHELLHVGVDDKGRTCVNPHDFEDFKLIVDKYGTDYLRKTM